MTRDSARHEACHAVVAVALRVRVRHAAIAAQGLGGEVVHDNCDPMARAVLCLAPAALPGERLSDPDREYVNAALARLKGDLARNARVAEAQARDLVRRHQVAIAEVAAELRRRGKLFGHEIAQIVDRHRRTARATPAPRRSAVYL